MAKVDPCDGQTDVEIKVLRKNDLTAAVQLEEPERWNQTAADWQRLLRLNPRGCFGAFCGQRLIGTVTSITYGHDVAWIGMLLVAQEYRGKGIGRQLMRTILEYCQRSRVATVKLDATPVGRPLYESLGFVVEDRIERWQGTMSCEVQCKPASHWKVPSSLYELDERAFYAPRTELLRSLIEDACVEPAVKTRDSTRSLAGYALARRGARASYIGPLVAIDRDIAVILLDSILERMTGDICLDVPIGPTDLTAVLKERGFTKQRELRRMSFGRRTRASELIFAIAGPELG